MCRIDSWSAMQILQESVPTRVQLFDSAVALARPFAESCARRSVLWWVPLMLADRRIKLEVEIQFPDFAQFNRALLKIERERIIFRTKHMFPDGDVELDEYGDVVYGIWGFSGGYSLACIRRNRPLDCITVQFA